MSFPHVCLLKKNISLSLKRLKVSDFTWKIFFSKSLSLGQDYLFYFGLFKLFVGGIYNVYQNHIFLLILLTTIILW